jgi:zinc transport system permease protein
MSEMLAYTFMQHALLAGVLVGIIAGIIGSLVVVNRMVFLAGGIAHAAYGGVGMAIYFSLPIFFGASLFSVAVALLLAKLSFDNRHQTDTMIGLIWAIGMAVGIILIELTPGYQSDFMSYLFGSIIAVSEADLWYMASLVVILALMLTFFYNDIVSISYDPNFAMLRGIPVKLFYTLLLILTSLAVVVAMRVVGLILVMALLTIPTFIADKLANSLLGMMIYSALLAIVFTLSGLIIAYYYDLSTGATIILVGAVSLLLFMSGRKLVNVYKKRNL